MSSESSYRVHYYSLKERINEKPTMTSYYIT